jgi:hypothetical protein
MATTDPKELPTTFEDVFDGLAFEGLQILYERQRKYGPRNIFDQGLWGVWQRIRADKMARVDRSFNGTIEKGKIVLDEISDEFSDETWEDTLFDISNLALIMIALKRGDWGKPMREDTDEVAVLAADGVPQLTLTPEEEEAEQARKALAGEYGSYAQAFEEDQVSIDDATPEEWDEAANTFREQIAADQGLAPLATEADLDDLQQYMENRLEEARERVSGEPV